MDISGKDKYKYKEVDVSCGSCGKPTRHTIITSVELENTYKLSLDTTIDEEDSYQIIQCNGCLFVSFRRITHSTEPAWREIGPGEYEEDLQEIIYPNPIVARKMLDDDMLLPSKIRLIYHETIRSLNSQLPVLCGIGIRSLIEAVCKEKNANGNKLLDKINDLVALGVSYYRRITDTS